MFILSILLSAAVSADAFLMGAAYGIKNVKIPVFSQLIIGAFACLCSFFSVFVSKLIFLFVQADLSKTISIVSLFLIGCYFLVKAVCINVRPEEEISLINFAIKSLGLKISVVRDMSRCDIDGSGVIDKKEAVLLGLALSGDIAAVGLFAAPGNTATVLFPLFTGIFNILCIYAGNRLGQNSKLKNHNLKKIADFALPVVIFVSLLAKLFFE